MIIHFLYSSLEFPKFYIQFRKYIRLFKGIEHISNFLILRLDYNFDFLKIRKCSKTLQNSLNPSLIRPRTNNINPNFPDPQTTSKNNFPLSIPISQLLQILPSIFIIAYKLRHHHNIIPIIMNLYLFNRMLNKFIKCIFHYLYTNIV